MLRIAQNSVDGRLNRNTCSSTEVAQMQCARGLNYVYTNMLSFLELVSV